jgi:Holliday junction resolvase RusA-like endonuclease
MAHGRLQIMFDDEVRDDILTYPYHIAFTTNGEKGQPFVIRSATVTLNDPMNTSYASFTLPYPPSLNNLYATVRGRRVLSAEGRNYKEGVKLVLTMAGIQKVSGVIRLTVKVYRPRKAGDLDNTLKVVLDGITGVGWEDDRQVEHIHAYRFEDKANPRVEVEILDMGKMADEIAAAEMAVDWVKRVKGEWTYGEFKGA